MSMQETLERLRKIRESKGPDHASHTNRAGVENQGKDWKTLWNETLDRLDEIYELGDLARLKQDRPFYEKLMEIEAVMEQSILNGRGYEEAIRRFDECIREGLSKLRR